LCWDVKPNRYYNFPNRGEPSRLFFFCNNDRTNAGCQTCPSDLFYSVKCAQCLPLDQGEIHKRTIRSQIYKIAKIGLLMENLIMIFLLSTSGAYPALCLRGGRGVFSRFSQLFPDVRNFWEPPSPFPLDVHPHILIILILTLIVSTPFCFV